jgi:hypothetical protein
VNYIVNGYFSNGTYGWRQFSSGVNTVKDSVCGWNAAQFVITGGGNNTGAYIMQHTVHFGCYESGGKFWFGLAMRKGLTLSLWHRTLNSSHISFIVVVTFHNGTSKLSIHYLLAYRGVPPKDVRPDLVEGYASKVINTSSTQWQHSTFDLYQDFVTLFNVDPVKRHYCINYISIGESLIDRYSTGNLYSYVTGIELTYQTQALATSKITMKSAMEN